MREVVLYGVGSAVVVDFEESLQRTGHELAAGIQNKTGEVYLLNKSKLIFVEDFNQALTGHPFMVPLFTPGNRQKAAQEAASRGFKEPFSLIDRSVICPRALEFKPGLFVNSGCTLGAASQFGEFVFINRGATLGHHAKLGAFVSIGPGAVIAGQVQIGKGSVIGVEDQAARGHRASLSCPASSGTLDRAPHGDGLSHARRGAARQIRGREKLTDEARMNARNIGLGKFAIPTVAERIAGL